MMRMRPVFLCLFYFVVSQIVVADTKINGVSFVASREKALPENVSPVVAINANYAAIMPFGFVSELGSPELRFNTKRQWYGGTISGARQYIELLQQSDIKVMIKPQIWVWRGGYTGHIEMKTEEQWRQLEAGYREFILAFASLAEKTNAEIFCIGTELEAFVSQRPAFWSELIKDVRAIYKGELTYAANWDEYPRVPFWQQLDYIGVDAYFPVSDETTPSVDQAQQGWQKWKIKLRTFSEDNNSPILFTEFGYRSIDYAGREPWKSDHSDAPANMVAQSNLTKALFEEFWYESWFAGGFIWKWFIDHEQSGGEHDNRFTPQNKSSEELIRRYYAKAAVER